MTKPTDGPRSDLTPPKHLRPATAAWWLRVTQRWELEEHHLRLLSLAAEAWDRTQHARELIRREGLIIEMPSGARRPHPAVSIEADSASRFARMLRELDLDLEAPAEAKRPPALLSLRGGKAG